MTENLHTTDCIRTFTGRYINVFEPTLDMIDIEDIAHGLSHTCRWGGHVQKFYSVAEHSVHCCDLILDKNQVFEALMHDASEAYLLDIPKPIKNRLTEYKIIEDNLMKVISEKFGFNYPLSQEVKDVDNLLLQMEWNTIIIGDIHHKELLSLASPDAKALFLNAFHQIKRI